MPVSGLVIDFYKIEGFEAFGTGMDINTRPIHDDEG
jgi:hypothetical protein